MTITLRPATSTDVDAVASIWHSAWRDAHLGHVPDGLLPERTLANFRSRTPARIAFTTLSVRDEQTVGFVIVSDDELEQLFVASAARGTGAAAMLIDHAEALIARRFDTAWLAVVAGNARARRFYERQGWHDAGPIAYQAELSSGGSLIVPSRRYEKRLR